MSGPRNKGKGKAIVWLKAHLSYEGEECIAWPFSRTPKGYGMLGWNGKRYWAHRLMCMLAHGDPPTPKHQAAHDCGKGHEGCVNPRHLAWKTPYENHMDCEKTGTLVRNRHGTRSILSPEQIAQIIALKGVKSQVKIAKMFGISPGSVEYWHRERSRRYTAEKPEPQYRIDAILAGAAMPLMDLAHKMYPDPKSWGKARGGEACVAVLCQTLKRHGFDMRDGIVYPRAAKAA